VLWNAHTVSRSLNLVLIPHWYTYWHNRVLVVQQLTVDTTIGDAEILQGLQQGCDCIYSSVT
jgi:hypothetical protein